MSEIARVGALSLSWICMKRNRLAYFDTTDVCTRHCLRKYFEVVPIEHHLEELDEEMRAEQIWKMKRNAGRERMKCPTALVDLSSNSLMRYMPLSLKFTLYFCVDL